MWLINASTLELEAFQQCPIDTYAILSHTWGAESEELNFDEFRAGEGRHKIGFEKVKRCCELAWDNGLDYAWVDTCCIDKRSSAELSEAINSMFSWYEHAKECYVYLADVPDSDLLAPVITGDKFRDSRWFTRGWTLQELIAPKAVSFYNRDWNLIGDRRTHTKALYAATGIELDVLESTKDFRACSIAQRMSWAARRQTTRSEDLAYCLLGLFGVNMPLLYGEGSKAFARLQEELIRHTDDETIFAWTGGIKESYGLLAPSVSCFSNAANIHRSTKYRERPHLEITNRGLKLECQMLACEMNTYSVPLQCEQRLLSGHVDQMVIFIARTLRDDQYRRVTFKGRWTDATARWDISKSKISTIFVPDDAQSVKLAPRGGQPVVHIISNMFAWQFPESGNYELMRVRDMIMDTSGSLPTNKDIPKRLTSTIELAKSFKTLKSDHCQRGVVRCGETNSHESNSQEWAPRTIGSIEFQPQTLEEGVAVAFTRSNSWRHKFYYHVEVGFDMDFLPVCVLYARPFKLAIQNGSRLSNLVTQLSWSLFGNRGHVPFWGNFWNHEGCRCLGATPAIEHSLESKGCKVCCLGISSSWYPMILQAKRFDPFQSRGEHHERNDVRIVRGQRFDGLEIRTDDSLPYPYGCVDMHLKFRHLHGLAWELEIKEVPLHTGSVRHGIVCNQRVKTSISKVLVNFNLIFRLITMWDLRSTVLVFFCYLLLPSVLDYYKITHSHRGIGVVALAAPTITHGLVNLSIRRIGALWESANGRLAHSHRNHEVHDHHHEHYRLHDTSSTDIFTFAVLATTLGCPALYTLVIVIIWSYIAW